MSLFTSQNLLLLGFFLAMAFGLLASLAMIYQLRQNQFLSRRLADSEIAKNHLERDVETVTQAMTEGLYLLRLERNVLTVDRYYSSVTELPRAENDSPLDSLLKSSDLDASTIAEILGCLRASFGVSILQWDFNAKILPKEIQHAGDRRLLDFRHASSAPGNLE